MERLLIRIRPPRSMCACLSSRVVPRDMEEDECPICLGNMIKTLRVITSCGHIFHAGCFNKLTYAVCPMCRTPLK